MFAITLADDEPLAEAVSRGLAAPAADLAALPQLSSVALGDPYLAGQLVALRGYVELTPPPQASLLSRLRARLAWWLLGPELRRQTEANAALVRIIDSLLAQIDRDRARVQGLEEQRAFREGA
jgi:hypothetical protein